jgi:RHS repeat-associated protein
MNWLDGSESVICTLSYSYDAAGQLLSAADPAAAYEFEYNLLGRLTSELQSLTGLAFDIEYQSEFDANSRRTQLLSLLGGQADFANTFLYDNLNRLTVLTQESGGSGPGANVVAEKRVDFAYNAASQFSQISRYADWGGFELVASTFYAYDGIGRLSSLIHATDSEPPLPVGEGWGSGALTGYEFTYDAASRITAINSFVDGFSAFNYDNTDQLTAAGHAGQPDESYTYDENGNRTMSGYSTTDNNQLTTDGVYNYTYDDEGNRLTKTRISTGEKEEYAWDHRNRLTKVTFKDSSGTVTKTVEHTYDIFDRWIKRSVDVDGPGSAAAVDTYFSWEANQINLQFDTEGDLTHRYLWNPAAIDQILADESVTSLMSAGEILWPLTDHLGTPRDLASYDDSTDEITIENHRVFNSFGVLTSETNASFTTLVGFTGVFFDISTGLNYHRARWLDMAAGRWMSEDPIGFGGNDANLSRYVGNSATLLTDPSGLVAPIKIPTIELPPSITNVIVSSPAGAQLYAPIGMFNDSANVFNRTDHIPLITRLYVIGGTVAGSMVGVRQCSDAFHQNDAVDGHKQGALERVQDGATGVVQLFFTGRVTQLGTGLGKGVGPKIQLPAGPKPAPTPTPEPSPAPKPTTPEPVPTPDPLPEGSFSISNWTGYPWWLPRPKGPFRILRGAEYDAARMAANSANRAIRAGNPDALKGMEIHEIHPVKLCGSPTDLANKAAIPGPLHRAQVTPWWNRLIKRLEDKE